MEGTWKVEMRKVEVLTSSESAKPYVISYTRLYQKKPVLVLDFQQRGPQCVHPLQPTAVEDAVTVTCTYRNKWLPLNGLHLKEESDVPV